MSGHSSPKFFPLGEGAFIVEFGRVISKDLNRKAIALADLLDRQPFAGYVESVPAYASTAVFYDLSRVRRAFPAQETAFNAVRSVVEPLISVIDEPLESQARLVEIPAVFDIDAGPDLGRVSENAGLSCDEVIGIFTSPEYQVYMLGFLPGFAYLGDVDERIATPRRRSPRITVPPGSIGIAGRQAGVYSLSSPGGWQIIGRTQLKLFDPTSAEPSLLKPGDHVIFVPAC